MERYIVSIYDIKNIGKHVFIEEVPILAEGKADASDKAHTLAFEKHPNISRLVSVRKE